MLRPFDAQLISCIFSLIELSIITLIGVISFCQAVISNTTAEKNIFFSSDALSNMSTSYFQEVEFYAHNFS